METEQTLVLIKPMAFNVGLLVKLLLAMNTKDLKLLR